ncbi:MAG: hypothetical protein IPK19_40690 [Chloroflexi bacterium]|nr:hypothetical protein [Chloroflexota bacterium]
MKEIHRRCLQGAVEKSDADLFPRADGTDDWVRWEIRPWRDHRGEVGGILLFFGSCHRACPGGTRPARQ